MAVNPEYVQKKDNGFQQTTVFNGNPGYIFDSNSDTSPFLKTLATFYCGAIGGIGFVSLTREMHYGGCGGGGLFSKDLGW